MEFRLLGSLEVVAEGRPLGLGAAKQRALLAVLVLNANRVVSTDRLIDALWGGRPPDAAAHTLQVYVSQLRKALRIPGSPPPETILVTQGPGYVLRIRPEDVDVQRFDRMVGEGRRALRAGEAERAADLLREALELWRGPPLPEFADEAFAQAEIARIQDLRLSAIEDRIQADLSLGKTAELVSELQALVAEHPLRERLRAHLMHALYASGRQAEALGTFQDARQLLADELGIDPSPDLQRLERAILRQDPGLEIASVRGAPAERLVAGGRARGRLVVTALIGLAVIGATIVSVVRSSGSRPVVSLLETNSIGKFDPDGDRLVASIPTAGYGPTAMVWFDESLWVANTISRTVARIDPTAERVEQSVPTEETPTGLTAGEGAVWVLNGLQGKVLAIDPRSNQVIATINVPAGSGGIAFGAGGIWVTNTLDGTVTRIDPRTREVDGTIALPESVRASPKAIAASGDDLWVGDEFAPLLWHIDATTGRVVATLGLRGAATAIRVGDGEVWVASRTVDLVTDIDPKTGLSSTHEVGDGPTGIALGFGSVWVANGGDGTLSRIDISTGRVDETIHLGSTPDGVTVGSGDVWVSVPA